MERDQPAVARRLRTMTIIGVGMFIGLVLKMGELQSRVVSLESKSVEHAKQHADAVGAASEEWPLCPTTP